MDASMAAALADVHRTSWAFALAAAARVTGDLDDAEECVQDAYAHALASWPIDGVPTNPGGWLTVVARRRAIDTVRRRVTVNSKLAAVAFEPFANLAASADLDAAEADHIVDDRLRLIFTSCHPALAPDARVALTLRLLCGLSTAEVAAAFMTSEPTMAARLARAKKKIRAAHIPYVVPGAEELGERTAAVLDVIHLVFTTGHTAPTGKTLQRRDLTERALDLARMLHTLLPRDAAVAGLLALLLLTDARRAARIDATGRIVVLSEQDRSRWDQDQIRTGLMLLARTLTTGAPSRYALMAAIAAVHDEAESWDHTDWQQIVNHYDQLVAIWPSPVVALNRAIALGYAIGPTAALEALDTLSQEPTLARYHYLPAARAEFHEQLGHHDEARLAYQEASLFATNYPERRLLEERLARLEARSPTHHGEDDEARAR
jgi:RNA polymerase sigma-70 factor (ECF subfamily)